MSDENHYDALGVSPNASKEKIREAYQTALDEAQADQQRESSAKRPSESAIATARTREAEVRAAWQVLSDPYQRGRYDATLEMGAAANGQVGVDDDEDVEVDTMTDEQQAIEDAVPPWRKKQRARQLAAEAARGPLVTTDGTPLELAGTGRRAMAALIDIVVVLLGWGISYGIALAGNYNDATIALILQGVVLGLFIGYFMFPTISRGQSFGKKLTHVMLVDRASGHLPTANRVLMHYLPTLVALFLFGPQGAPLGILVGLSFLMTRDGMSLGDKFAKTAVVIARYRPERVR